jgi:hypothetical protein
MTVRSYRVRRYINCDRTFLSLAGDLDLVVGEFYSLLNYFENIGTSKAPAFVQRTGSANPFEGIVYSIWSGWNSSPALGDLDGDGTLRPCPLTNEL